MNPVISIERKKNIDNSLSFAIDMDFVELPY